MGDNARTALVSAQGPDGQSALFFVNEYGDIDYFISQNPAETQWGAGSKMKEYTQKDLQVDNKNVNAGSKDLDAISWEDAKTYYTRLYFADSKNILQELCLDIDKTNPSAAVWKFGILGKQNIQVRKDFSITSHINLKGQQLKVYFFSADPKRANDNKPLIAWHPLGSDAWQVLTKSV